MSLRGSRLALLINDVTALLLRSDCLQMDGLEIKMLIIFASGLIYK